MQTITEAQQLESLENGNRFIGTPPTLRGSTAIVFRGSNNILYCDDGVTLENCRIEFGGNDAVVFLSSHTSPYKVRIHANHKSAVYFGVGGYFNTYVTLALAERKHMFVGDECFFSTGIWLRNADPHLIYDIETRQRKNPSKSIFIGDHVWVGQNALVLKGSRIHSGSIIGGGSVVTGKRIPSNQSWAGNPCRKVGEKIFWHPWNVNSFLEEHTRRFERYEGEEYIFPENPEQFIPFETLDDALTAAADAQARFDCLRAIRANTNKSRFAWQEPVVKRGLLGRLLKRT